MTAMLDLLRAEAANQTALDEANIQTGKKEIVAIIEDYALFSENSDAYDELVAVIKNKAAISDE